jgi:outer membrane protein
VEAIDFPEAIRRAGLHATLATLAAQDVVRAEALVVQARSASLPQLVASGYDVQTSTHHLATSSGPPRLLPDNGMSGNVTLSVPLVAPSRWFQWSHASDQLAVAGLSEKDVRRTVTVVAARVYLSVLASKRAVELGTRAVDVARAHAQYASARRQAGMGSALDAIRTEQSLAAAQAQLEASQTALIRSQEALGLATGGDRPLDAKGDPDLAAGFASIEQLLTEAERSRTDVAVARERADAAHRVTRDSWSDWAPSLVANGQAFANDPANPPSTFRDGWQIQLALSFPIFEGFLRSGVRQERAALEAQAMAQLDAATRQARADVRTAVGALGHAVAGLEQSRIAAARAQTALGLVTDAFRAGAITSLDVIDADQRARDADLAAVVAEDGVRQSQLDLLAAAGRFP